jgi:alkyl hydroperoxide reductase subunit AhpC
VAAVWGADGCVDFEYLEESVIQHTAFEASIEKFPNLKLINFLLLTIEDQKQVIAQAFDSLRNPRADQSRMDRSAIVTALQSIALSEIVTAEIRGKCLDVLEFWRNPF